MSKDTVKKVLVASMGAALAGALAHTSSAGAAVLSASNGFADDSTLSECFQRSWNNPGQVRYNHLCPNTSAWYDIPMPIFATGNKNFSVYIRTSWPFQIHCDLFVLRANGTIARWNEQEFDGEPDFENWINFPQNFAVNANESATIQCEVPIGPEGTTSDSFISTVKGF